MHDDGIGFGIVDNAAERYLREWLNAQVLLLWQWLKLV